MSCNVAPRATSPTARRDGRSNRAALFAGELNSSCESCRCRTAPTGIGRARRPDRVQRTACGPTGPKPQEWLASRPTFGRPRRTRGLPIPAYVGRDLLRLTPYVAAQGERGVPCRCHRGPRSQADPHVRRPLELPNQIIGHAGPWPERLSDTPQRSVICRRVLLQGLDLTDESNRPAPLRSVPPRARRSAARARCP